MLWLVAELQSTDIFGGNNCNLLLYLTSKHVFENLFWRGSCLPLVAGLDLDILRSFLT